MMAAAAAAAASQYRIEKVRLQSFKNRWPIGDVIRPSELANAGFYYLGNGDFVKCFECGLVLSKWVSSDIAIEEHERWMGRCRFIRSLPCGNVPLGKDPETIPEAPPACIGVDVCGPYDDIIKVDDSWQSPQREQKKSPSCVSSVNICNATFKDLACVVCSSEKKSILLLPCSHLSVGVNCAKNLIRCTQCNGVVVKKVQILM